MTREDISKGLPSPTWRALLAEMKKKYQSRINSANKTHLLPQASRLGRDISASLGSAYTGGLIVRLPAPARGLRWINDDLAISSEIYVQLAKVTVPQADR